MGALRKVGKATDKLRGWLGHSGCPQNLDKQAHTAESSIPGPPSHPAHGTSHQVQILRSSLYFKSQRLKKKKHKSNKAVLFLFVVFLFLFLPMPKLLLELSFIYFTNGMCNANMSKKAIQTPAQNSTRGRQREKRRNTNWALWLPPATGMDKCW